MRYEFRSRNGLLWLTRRQTVLHWEGIRWVLLKSEATALLWSFGSVYTAFIFYKNGMLSVCTELRLAGNVTARQGRLEVSYNGLWGTVCDDLFDDADAAVACFTLGYG